MELLGDSEVEVDGVVGWWGGGGGGGLKGGGDIEGGGCDVAVESKFEGRGVGGGWDEDGG